MRWEPLFVGAAAAPYRSFIEEEVDAVASPDRQLPRNPMLWTGCAGEALALHHLGRFLDRDVSGPVSTLIDQAVAQLDDGVVGDGLFMGMVGIGLVLARLEDDLPFDCTDVLSVIDDHVAVRLEDASDANYELYGGRAGDALYALERSHKPRLRAALGAFLGWLEARAVHGAAGAHWSTRPTADYSANFGLAPDRPVVLLGMAHGLAGLLPVLAGMVRAGIEAPRAQSLLDAAWSFIRQSAATSGRSRFPAGLCDGRPYGPARFKWCNGDPGVLGAAAAAFGSAAPGLAGLVDLPARVALALEDDEERGLCCGDAGRGLIFHILALETGIPSVRRAAEEAFARARRPGPAPVGILGYGRIGVALAFASALSTEPPAWCSVMGLAARGDRGSPT